MDDRSRDFETTAGYSIRERQAILRTIGRFVPDAISVRTDRTVAGPISETNGQRIYLELPSEKFRVGLHADASNRPSGFLVKKFDLSYADADELQFALTELALMNPMGAWPLKRSTVPAFEISNTHARGAQIAPTSYLAETCDILAEDLPSVGSIEVDYLITGNPKSKVASRRRAFIRFNGHEPDVELLSIDSAGMPLHARKQILKTKDDGETNEMFHLNLFRMERWATALSTDPDTLSELFPTLGFLTSSLHVSKISL